MIYNILAQRCTKFRQRDRAILGQFIFRKIIYIKFSLLAHIKIVIFHILQQLILQRRFLSPS